MEIRKLGRSGLAVTDICFGALPMGPLQVDMPLEEGAELISYALDQGINFIDTAEVYRTYKYIKKAISDRRREEIVIASKSPAKDYDGMKEHIDKGLKELNLDYFDIFHLHAARVEEPFVSRQGALECLLDYKKKGKIKAIGIATHYIKVVKEAADRDEIDVVFSIVNKKGMGIIDGTPAEMLEAMEYAHRQGKGVYAMKPLAGGNLLKELEDAINFVRKRPFITSTAIGMVKKEEVDVDLLVFADRKIPENLVKKTDRSLKRLRISAGLCQQCGFCIEECPNQVITMGKDRAVVNHAECILCGYCSRVCPEFAIRLA